MNYNRLIQQAMQILFPTNNVIDSLLPVVSDDVPYLIVLTDAIGVSISLEDILEYPA